MTDEPGATAAPPRPLEVVVVTSPGCHFCKDALAVLSAAGEGLHVRAVDSRSDEGLSLVARHRPALQPLVIIDGMFFSAGRLPRGKLRKALEARRHG